MTDEERKRQIAVMNAYAHSCETRPDRTERQHEDYAERHWQDHWPTEEEFREIMAMPGPPAWFKLAFNVAALGELRNQQERLQRKKRRSRRDITEMAHLDQNVAWLEEQCRQITRELMADGREHLPT